MYYSEGAEETWNYGKYEELCIEITRKVLDEPENYIDCFLFMEP